MNCAQTEPRHAQAGAAEIMWCKSSTVRATELEPGLYDGGTEFSVNRFGGDTDRASAVYAGTGPLTADGPFRPEWLIPLTVPLMRTIPVSPVQCSPGRQISTSQHPTSGGPPTPPRTVRPSPQRQLRRARRLGLVATPEVAAQSLIATAALQTVARRRFCHSSNLGTFVRPLIS
jgi:hypothetical protein